MIDKCMEDKWKDGWQIDQVQMDGWMDEWMIDHASIDGWVDGQMDKEMDDQLNEWNDG